MATIVLATFMAFAIVMTGYFIADDTWQLQFAYRVFSGQWWLVADNFTHSYLGLPSMDFYRPLLGITYLADYALYHTAAWGYYLTNIWLAALAGIALYYLLGNLATFTYGAERAEKFAFVSALLFVSSPLHAEDICWISGRADLLAAPFFLFGLLAAARGRDWQSGKVNNRYFILSLAAFVLALLSKEAAVTMPLVVVAMYFYFGESKAWLNWSALKKFLLFLSPYGLITILYLFVRKEALGSFIGGYTGDMGEALGKWLLFRWLDPLNLFRMAFPVAKHSFHVWDIKVDQTPSLTIFGTIYAIIAAVMIVRFLTQKISWRLTIFLSLWLLTSIIPLFKLWGLDASLHNQRVLYLYTAPMVALLPAMLFAPRLADRAAMQKNLMVLTPAIEDFLLRVGTWAFYALTICLIVASALASYNWVQAGLQVEAIKNQTTALIEGQPKDDKNILVVSVPKDYLGAHVLMGGVNMLELLEPPFIKRHISQNMIGFQRALVGPGEPINSSRFKIELSALKKRRAYFWDVDSRSYKIIDYEEPAADTPASIDLPLIDPELASLVMAKKPTQWPTAVWFPDPPGKATFVDKNGVPTIALDHLKIEGDDGLMITGLDINPLAYDYLNMTISLPHSQQATGVYVAFDDKNDAVTPFKDEPQVSKLLQVTKVRPGDPLESATLNIKLSHFGQWYAFKKIHRMKLSFSNIPAVSVSQISISDDRKLLPQLFVMKSQAEASGEYFCRGADPVKFCVDAGVVPGATSCMVEISKVNQSWDTFLTEKAHGQDSVVNHSYTLPLKAGRAYFMLDPAAYAKNGFYDVRASLLDEKNQIISDWSDLITLYRPDPTGKAATFCADY